MRIIKLLVILLILVIYVLSVDIRDLTKRIRHIEAWMKVKRYRVELIEQRIHILEKRTSNMEIYK